MFSNLMSLAASVRSLLTLIAGLLVGGIGATMFRRNMPGAPRIAGGALGEARCGFAPVRVHSRFRFLA